MKLKMNFFERFSVPRIPAKYFFKERRKIYKNKRKLKRHEYRLRCKELIPNFKIPYLRISPNPFSIAFLILVIISSDLWPHTKSSLYVSCTPVHFRHYNHKMLTTSVNQNVSSKSNNLNDVNTRNSSSLVDKSNTLRNVNVNSGDMFLIQPQFLKRYGRSFKPYRISDNASRDEYSRSFSKSSSSSSSLISPCSHVGDDTNEISARAYMAETIFEGKVRSKSSVRDPGGKYGVTFVVQHVHKDQSNGQNALRPRTQVRLYFKQKLSTTKPTAHCVQRYNYTRRPGDLTKANIKRGRRYIVFVNGIGPHNYTILGEPVPKTKKNLQAVRDVLCRNCVRQIGVWGLKNVSIDVGKQLHLVCRIKGNPLPALQWFKDGSPIIVNSRLRIQYKKKRSLLVIPEVRNSDAGKYECRGLGVQSISPVSSSATVNINTRVNNITDLWPLAGKPCPMNLVYCLNGGSCTYYETIGEFTCQCADGFNGERCENKDVTNSNSTYLTCFDGVTPSYPCVTVHKPIDLFL